MLPDSFVIQSEVWEALETAVEAGSVRMALTVTLNLKP